MFETLEEAIETNSDCAFCRKPKFIPLENENKRFDLHRCTEEDCDNHCKWNHKAEAVKLELGGPDVISIASGWGA